MQLFAYARTGQGGYVTDGNMLRGAPPYGICEMEFQALPPLACNDLQVIQSNPSLHVSNAGVDLS